MCIIFISNVGNTGFTTEFSSVRTGLSAFGVFSLSFLDCHHLEFSLFRLWEYHVIPLHKWALHYLLTLLGSLLRLNLLSKWMLHN